MINQKQTKPSGVVKYSKGKGGNKLGKAKNPVSKQEKIEKIQKVAKVALKVATDPLVHEILKGVFNDDNDYVFNGYRPQLAANDTRPMDYVSLEQFIGSVSMGGVPDISKLNMAFDISTVANSDIMRISADRVMAELRESLRSNLIETSDDVANYLLAVLSLQVRIAQYTRALSTAKQTNGTNVHFNDVINSIGDPYSTTFIKAYRPEWTDPKSTIFAANANMLPLVEGLVNRLLVPAKYKNWINWYFNSIFVDQDGLHKQWYMNDARNIAKYRIGGYLGGTYLQFEGYEDFFKPTGNPLEDIRQLAIDIYSTYSILIADISKSNLQDKFNTMTMLNETRILNDASYFQYLVNTYATSKENLASFMQSWGNDLPYELKSYYTGDIKTAFIRYDALDGVEKDKLGPIQGLVSIATPRGEVAPTIIWPISQSTIIYVPNGIETNDYKSAVSGTSPELITLDEGLYSISIYSFMQGETSASMTASKTGIMGKPGERISLPQAQTNDVIINYTTSNVGRPFTYGQTFTFTINDTAEVEDYLHYSAEVAIMRGRLNGSVTAYGKFAVNPSELIYDNKPHTLTLDMSKSGDEGLIFNGEIAMFSAVPSGTFSIEYTAFKNGAHTAVITVKNGGSAGGGGVYTLTNPGASWLFSPLFFDDASVAVEYYTDSWTTWTVQVQLEGSNTVVITNSAANNVHFISDRFDYSIPVYYFTSFTVDGIVIRDKGLIKETYHPQLLELNSVKTTLEQMFLGLMSII